MDGSAVRRVPACRNGTRFRRFLDAEAWTDAAMMLIPGEDWGYQIMPQFCVLRHPKDRSRDVEAHGAYGLHPAHAFLAACLKAKEQADG